MKHVKTDLSNSHKFDFNIIFLPLDIELINNYATIYLIWKSNQHMELSGKMNRIIGIE